MGYFEGVVAEYLSADRAVFVNPACCIQLNEGRSLKASGPHWYCDVVAVSFRESAVYLCEVSYSRTLTALFKRLREWNAHWPGVCAAIARDNAIPRSWPVRPWLFVPETRRALIARTMTDILLPIHGSPQMPDPRVTSLEAVAPWRYPSRHMLPGAGEP